MSDRNTWERALDEFAPLPGDAMQVRITTAFGSTTATLHRPIDRGPTVPREIKVDFEDLDSAAIESIARDYSGQIDARSLPEDD